VRQEGGAFGAELVEEDVEGGVVAAGAGPHQVTAVVVDDDDQVAVPALVGDLIDPDPSQALEPIDRHVDLRVHAGHDCADGAPRDAQQFHHRALRRANREPRRERIEVASVASTMTRPRHRRDDHAMFAAPDPRSSRFKEHPRRPEIQRSPPTPTFTGVIAR
jgi:hypothetical protein